MKRHLLLLTASLSLTAAYGQTYVSGGIFTNTSWTLANSPYIVTDTLTLFPGATLTIQPGVVVKFNDSISFDVRGTLNAVGTQTDSITFTSSSPTPFQGIWPGLFISTWLGGNFNFTYCKFSYAHPAIYIGYNATYVPTIIKNCSFTENKSCIIGYCGWVINTIDNCVFKNNESAIGYFASSVGLMTITKCSFINNVRAIDFINFIDFYDCLFCGNKIAMEDGLSIYFHNSIFTYNGIAINKGIDVKLDSCIIAFNDTGIVLTDIPTINQSTICSNSSFNLINHTTNNISLPNNCWCDTDSVAISVSIYDGYDNVAYGLIDFTPLINCDSTAIPDTSYCANTLTGIHSPIIYRNETAKIYPNPFSTLATLQTGYQLQNASLTVYNSVGQTVKRMDNLAGQTIVFHRDNLPSGLYFVRLTQDGNTISSDKFVITDR